MPRRQPAHPRPPTQARLAETSLTPTERAERAEKAWAALPAWNRYAPTASEQHELARRLAQVQRP
ncbi:hypothetical protein DRB96_12305 [Streptomyces sp. ICC1]|nr:hypothetical protein DRB89_16345 [Streptomyces sp. ICC4]AWZ12973.1 hypothetical protein DRB96_12305 [Streptomyces sp. ICC1]